jgi:hypothetical protein
MSNTRGGSGFSLRTGGNATRSDGSNPSEAFSMSPLMSGVYNPNDGPSQQHPVIPRNSGVVRY